MAQTFLQQGDIIFRRLKTGIELHTINYTTATMAFSGVMRFKRRVIDNIWYTLDIPAADRIPLAPVYILLNTESYAKYKLYRFSLLPLFSDNSRNKRTFKNGTTQQHKNSAGSKHNKQQPVFKKPFKGNRKPAKHQPAISNARHTLAEVL